MGPYWPKESTFLKSFKISFKFKARFKDDRDEAYGNRTRGRDLASRSRDLQGSVRDVRSDVAECAQAAIARSVAPIAVAMMVSLLIM